jgi:hypothetical protein
LAVTESSQRYAFDASKADQPIELVARPSARDPAEFGKVTRHDPTIVKRFRRRVELDTSNTKAKRRQQHRDDNPLDWPHQASIASRIRH